MTKKKWLAFVLTLIMIFTISSGALAAVQSWEGSIEWDGEQGKDSMHCEYVGDGPRTADGWIHWILTNSGAATEAAIVLGGTGSGSYDRYELNGGASHFFTPYFDVEGLTAVVYFMGSLGVNPQLVISDYCPGRHEELSVSKTAVTSYARDHFWDIDKSVDTEDGWMLEGYNKIWLYVDGSGDETATWKVDVTYKGYQDSAWIVSGLITIENTGSLDAVITSIEDLLAGTPIMVACPVTLPYTLAAGETLVCTYSESGYVEGKNVATVTTERDTYTGEANIVWGAPSMEVNKTVHIQDISDLFGTVALGTVTAPNNKTFTYTKDFAWADYGAQGSGHYAYDNTAYIIETGQNASAKLLVNVQGFVYETAFAKGENARSFLEDGFSRWGWTNQIVPGTYEWDLWAGAAQSDTSKGTLVGTVTVTYNALGCVSVVYNVDSPYHLTETHVYAGYNKYPKLPVGKKMVDTVAPGAYTNSSPFDGGAVYVIAHAVVGLPDPNFGP